MRVGDIPKAWREFIDGNPVRVLVDLSSEGGISQSTLDTLVPHLLTDNLRIALTLAHFYENTIPQKIAESRKGEHYFTTPIHSCVPNDYFNRTIRHSQHRGGRVIPAVEEQKYDVYIFNEGGVFSSKDDIKRLEKMGITPIQFLS